MLQFYKKYQTYIIAGGLSIAAALIIWYLFFYEKVTKEMLGNSNIQAFLKMIRYAEGTAGAQGYNTMFGGKTFADLTDHPRVATPFTYKAPDGSIVQSKSDAAGAYQFMSATWDDVKAKLNLKDFSAASQDLAAVELIRRAGALSAVMSGDFKKAIDKCKNTWASLPNAPYGQPTKAYATLLNVYTQNGGSITT